MKQVWGGNCIFTAEQTPDVLEAVHDFTANYPDDKAAIIMTADHTAVLNAWIMFLFYDGPSPPEHVFKKFKALKPVDTTKTWDSYYDLVSIHINMPRFMDKEYTDNISSKTTISSS